MTPASIIPVFGSQRPYADLNFAGGSFGLDGRSVSDLTALPGFTFTRASLAMGYDATGKLVYGPHNLAPQSQAIVGGTGSWVSNSSTQTGNFIAAPDGTLTASRIVADGTAVNQGVYLSALSVIGRTDIFSVYLRGAVGGELVWIGDATSRYQATLTTSWQRFTNPSHAMVSNHNVIYALNNTAMTFYAWGAQLEAVTYQTTPSTYYPTTTAAYYGPRLVYDPVTLASQGILVEEARTNLALQSQTFSTTWVTADGVLTANTALAPDGTTTADKLVGTAASAAGRLVQSFTGSIGATYTLSCYVKSAGGTLARLYFDDNGSNSASVIYNSITGAVSTAAATTGGNWTAASSAAQQLGDGWWRFSLTFTATAVAPTRVALWHRDVSDGTNGLLFWQAQLEAGTGASSPIPTTTAAVTRAADVAAVTGLSVAAPLTMVSSGGITIATAVSKYMTQLDAGNQNNAVLLYLSNTAVRRAYAIAGGVAQADITVSTGVSVGDQWTIASRFETNNVNISTAGVLGTADTSATMPTGLANLRIGSSSVGAVPFSGTISRIRIYNRALTDAELQAITT